MKSIVAEDFMVKKLITLNPQMDVFKAVQLLLKNRISGAPVVDDRGKYLGVFSEKCSMQVLLDAAYESLPTNHVEAFMDTQPRTIKPDADLLSIAQVFLLTNYRRLPVVDEANNLLGQISRRDVLAAAMKHLDDLTPSATESSLLYLSALHNREEAPIS